MYATLAKRALTLTWPVLVPLAAAAVLLRAGLLPDVLGAGSGQLPVAGAWALLPRLVTLAAIGLAWRFNRIRLVLGAATVWAAAEASMVLPPGTARAAVAALMPLNLLVVSLYGERGFGTPVGIARFGFLGFQALVVVSLHQTDSVVLGRALAEPLFPLPAMLPAGLARPGILLFLGALGVLTWRMVRSRSAIDAALFGALVADALLLHTPGPPAERLVFLGATGLILLLGMVEASHTLAYRDELTGLPGRRALNEALQQMGGTYTLAMVDVDHFKKFNDSYGHDAGDQCLRFVAARLAAVTGGGRSYRYGGEEFTVLFPGKTVEDVVDHIEALREAIAASRFSVRAQGRPKRKPEKPTKAGPVKAVSVTVSMGAAQRDETLRDSQAVLKKADKRLYKSKKDGRNRVTTTGC